MPVEKKQAARGGKRGERAPTRSFTMRLRPPLFEEIKHAAEKAETSIAAEAERRLEQPVVGDLARLIDLAVRDIEKSAGRSWREDETAALRVKAALGVVVDLVLGSYPSREQVISKWREEYGRVKPGLSQRIQDGIKSTPEERAEVVAMLAWGKLASNLADDGAKIVDLLEREWFE